VSEGVFNPPDLTEIEGDIDTLQTDVALIRAVTDGLPHYHRLEERLLLMAQSKIYMSIMCL